MTTTSEFFDNVSRPVWLLVGFIAVLIIGDVDYATGQEIHISIFYLLPVAATTWFVGRTTGLVFAAISAASWFAADLFGGHHYSHPAIPYWNMLVRFGFFLIVLIVLSRLKVAYEHVKTLSSVDPLTGILNGRTFQERANAEIERARRYSHPFTVVCLDLDNFKAVNDRFGHSAGDNLLRLVTDIIRNNLRITDIFARVGGDEFLLFLPETGQESARTALDKILDRVTSQLQEAEWPVTLSVGAVTYLSPPDSVDSMILQADNLMYQVKHGGKNRILQELHGG